MPVYLSLCYCAIYMYYSDKNKRRLMHQSLYMYKRREIVLL